MTKLDNVDYELIDYTKYQKRINDLLSNPLLQDYKIEKKVIGKTAYGYDIDCLKIGRGPKHIFIVGGTHGSEIISVDFATQLINNLPFMPNFSKEEFTIFVVPLQNPEGFIVTTDSLNESHIQENFQTESYDYYNRYKIDNLIRKFIKDYNDFLDNLDSEGIPTISTFLPKFKNFLKQNNNLKRLMNEKLMPELAIFIAKIDDLENISDYNELRYFLIGLLEEVEKNSSNPYLLTFLSYLSDHYLEHDVLTKLSSSNVSKFHQEKFANLDFKIKNFRLRDNVLSMYHKFNHPQGSQVTFDATGTGINLNENHPQNPGIKIIRQNDIFMAVGARNNIRNYVPGPIGIPTLDINNFSFAPENKALYKLLKQSYDEGKYCATFLYHSTGGMIFYKPDARYLTDEKYQGIYNYNRQIADIYKKFTNYQLIENSDYTGYGDLLRRTFPGIFLVELSKMGGNPIAPYGDENNIYQTYNDNFTALNHILEHLSKNNILNKSSFTKVK